MGEPSSVLIDGELGESMSEVWGTVTAVDGEHAHVHIDESGCGRCHEPGGCGGHNLGKLFCPGPRTFRVLNPEHCGVGRRVRVRIGDGAVGRSALHAYALPVLALLAGAMAGSAWGSEAGAIGGALAGLLLGWLGLWRAQRRRRHDARWQASIRP
ncbi:MAG TPA: SoxR reducing system RseC family protein [Accumulibacter sp.]|uniref:SoxR reducing system RseC family protein n=1 Tax=Accumulibacter sp. TaxID=2053492 RepID=UPI0025EEA37D|nr:SoxR reducing system RseC family protein [Accumulibacter sp.]MCM8600172.1 SoxR reducing system RseC family protein [Accumulibacter sp.]MCM8663995.1 SoxR reducing system RseC family protein [Accumulibacter sp.]HNC51953.1 SoxR reducing system RseC family protein [Accumulibacter sp.]